MVGGEEEGEVDGGDVRGHVATCARGSRAGCLHPADLDRFPFFF